ncbi:MAG: acyl-CoA thioesterase [Ignavibacteriales bacterium]
MDDEDVGRRLAAYPLITEIRPRYRDVDPLRHLNNVAQASYYEEGVMALHRRAFEGLTREPGHGVVFQVTLRFLAEGSYPEPLQLGGGIKRVGRTSYEFTQALFQAGVRISVCNTVVVYLADGRPSPLPDANRAALTSLLVSGHG